MRNDRHCRSPGASANKDICAKGTVNAKRALCAIGGILVCGFCDMFRNAGQLKDCRAVALPRLWHRRSALPANEEIDEAQDQNDVTSWLRSDPGAWAGPPAPGPAPGDVNGAGSKPMRKWSYLRQSTNGSICDKVTLQSPGRCRGRGRPGRRQVWCSNSGICEWPQLVAFADRQLLVVGSQGHPRGLVSTARKPMRERG